MKLKTKLLIFFIILIPLIIGGCSGTRAVIQDRNGLETEVTNFELGHGKKMEVFDGLAFRQISLNEIGRLRIYPGDIKIKDGIIYYGVTMELMDDTKITSYSLPDGIISKAYIRIDDHITAKTQAGTYQIDLKDTRSIVFLIF